MRTRPVLLTTAIALVAVLASAGCAEASTPASARAAAATTSYRNLPTAGLPDYQLGGGYTPAVGVTIVERDSTDRPASGKYGICYVNGFQTQPGRLAAWKRTAPSALLRDAKGRLVSDPGWPDEVLLDTRTAAKRAAITKELTRYVARCADRGFDAVEFDNLDSWTRSGKRLTRAGNLALAKALVRVGHGHGLAVGQKNTPQLGTAGRKTTGFDFVVAEECVQYDECSAYTAVYGKRVIDIEYSDTLGRSWESVCGLRDRPAMTILRDRDLVTPDDDEYVFEHC
ncbi:hypothetical protein DEJ23_07580 [Curtobacterium sp. MCSS17_008]|uniref:endo alpha-1,4 polygalactosaminidase n=1 Tax=Curtobacterium sp. MCSS17_008 TaxID=2175647 RepID=UPI000DA72786|nr:endo alpha-1,4 polygalactosaminidase [Curtobacterium sp. MCSS17_008]PZF57464.1 hypothetical protein DEJ23_07580 [Curtobacterium sp. MCSS17_008]